MRGTGTLSDLKSLQREPATNRHTRPSLCLSHTCLNQQVSNESRKQEKEIEKERENQKINEQRSGGDSGAAIGSYLWYFYHSTRLFDARLFILQDFNFVPFFSSGEGWSRGGLALTHLSELAVRPAGPLSPSWLLPLLPLPPLPHPKTHFEKQKIAASHQECQIHK